MKKISIFNHNNFKEEFFLYVLIFLYITVILVNFKYNSYSEYKNSGDFKLSISKELSSTNEYNLYPNRTCQITGSMHDKHQVRWVKNYTLKKIYQFSNNFNPLAAYYIDIFLHSFVIFFSFFLINKTFNFNKKYNYLFLAYITFIFQQYLGEYSYSIFEMFFLSLALYSSKNRYKFLFLISCIFAVLNRESGFIVLLSWFIFNNDIKKFLFISSIVLFFFLILNLDLIPCLINLKFFVPFEKQIGQTNWTDIFGNNLFSSFKLLFINFLLPFGLFYFFFNKTLKKNKSLLLIIMFYFLAFIIATPAHHMAVRMILLPLIFSAIHFYSIDKKKISKY